MQDENDDASAISHTDDTPMLPDKMPSETDLSKCGETSSVGSAAPMLRPLNERDAIRLFRSTCSQRSNVHIGFTIYSVSRVAPVEQSFDADIRIYCRWYDKKMAFDPDIVSLRATSRLAVGTLIPRREDGKFPEAVVKVIDPKLVVATRPKYELANAKVVKAVQGTDTICAPRT